MNKIISKDLEYVDFDDTVDNIISKLTKLKVKYSGYHNLRIDEECAYGDGYYHYFRGDILETDEQEATREKYENDNFERKLVCERKQYETLKAKFEKN